MPRSTKVLVYTSIPTIISIAPIAGLKYFRCFTILRINPVDFVKKAPVIRNGIHNPREYANNELYAAPGEVAANANMLPNIGPTHGVQQPANAAPNTNDVI